MMGPILTVLVSVAICILLFLVWSLEVQGRKTEALLRSIEEEEERIHD
jgi:hypothetical protein